MPNKIRIPDHLITWYEVDRCAPCEAQCLDDLFCSFINSHDPKEFQLSKKVSNKVCHNFSSHISKIEKPFEVKKFSTLFASFFLTSTTSILTSTSFHSDDDASLLATASTLSTRNRMRSTLSRLLLGFELVNVICLTSSPHRWGC